MMTIDQVRCFIAVAEELHFGRAAQRLAMTQPPLSRQIQKLEREVGARLFARDNRGVELTPAGAAFLGEAHHLMGVVVGAASLARGVQSGSAGRIRLGFTAVSAMDLLGPLLRRLASELPAVELILHERVSGAQVEGIRRGELDLGLARPPFDVASVSSRLVHREGLLAALPEGHRLAGLTGPLAPEDFETERIIGYHFEQARYFHELCAQFLLNANPRITQRVQQILTALLLVAAGEGCGFVPASARALGVSGVVFRPLAVQAAGPAVLLDPERPVELHAIWPHGAPSPATRRVLRVLDAVVADRQRDRQ